MKLIAINNIFLLVICAPILIIGYMVTSHEQTALKDLHWKVKDLEGRREIMVTCMREIEKSKRQPMESVKAKHGKFIAAMESPDITFAYFDKLTRRLSPSLNYLFKTSVQKQSGPLSENQYTLEGTGSFADIYQFVHALENSQTYYCIHHLQLKQAWNPFIQHVPESDKENEITFTSEISGYSLHGVEGDFPPAWVDYSAKRPLYDLFSLPRLLVWELSQQEMATDNSTRIRHGELPTLLPGALLVAISGNIAHVRDNAGKLIALRQGDEVSEGKVSRINLEEGTMEITSAENGEKLVFRVNETGIWGKR